GEAKDASSTSIVELDHLNIPGLTKMRKLSDHECHYIKQHFPRFLARIEQEENVQTVCSVLEKAVKASVRIAGDKCEIYGKLARLYHAQGKTELATRAQKLAEH